jgi:hypothetical protein
MAQLNGYTNSNGDAVPIVPRPVDKHSPNGIARITPTASRSYAKLAYKAWADVAEGVRERTLFSSILGGSAAWIGGTYITFTTGADAGYVWFTHDGDGSDPSPGGTNLGVVRIVTADAADDVARKLYLVLNNLANTTAHWRLPATEVTAIDDLVGVRADATLGTVSGVLMTITVTVQGAAPIGPWDGVYTDYEGPQNLTYSDE